MKKTKNPIKAKKSKIYAKIEKIHSITINYLGNKLSFESYKYPTKKDMKLILNEVRESIVAIKYYKEVPNKFYLYKESELHGHIRQIAVISVDNEEFVSKISEQLKFNSENPSVIKKVLPFLEHYAVC